VAAVIAVVALYNVIWPQMIFPILFGSQSERILAIIRLFLGILIIQIGAEIFQPG
jgi:hypothetical protein